MILEALDESLGGQKQSQSMCIIRTISRNLNEVPNFAESFLPFILLFYYIALILITCDA